MARGKNPLAQLTGCDSTAQRILSGDSSMGIGVLVSSSLFDMDKS